MRYLIFWGTIALVLTYFFWPSGPKFTDEGIDHIKESIKTEFEKKSGMKVSEVFLMRENDRKLSGFAKVKLGEFEFNKDCTATMGENGNSYWSCK